MKKMWVMLYFYVGIGSGFNITKGLLDPNLDAGIRSKMDRIINPVHRNGTGTVPYNI